MEWARRSLTGPPLSATELEALLGRDTPLLMLLQDAFEVRRTFFGNRVQVHILNNAQNARCPEDCGYCSQSAVTQAPLRPYAWKSGQELLKEARAELNDAKRREMYVEMQKIIRDEGGSVIPIFTDFVDAAKPHVKFDNLSGHYELDGARCGDRWWFA